MNIDLTKKLSLAEYGETWKDCYLEFRMPSFRFITENITAESTEKDVVGVLESLFVSGRVLSEGKDYEMKSDDVKDLPVEVMMNCIALIKGEVDPKLETA